MTTPLLFGKRRPLSAGAAAQYVGTETEIDGDKVLKGR
jgi:hypothetical protein